MDTHANGAIDLGSLPPEEQEEVLLTAGDLIMKESLVRLAEQMDDATATEFDELLTRGASEEEIAAFIQTRVPGAEAAMKGAVDDVQGAILGDKP